jgi:hypothetical protein
MDQASILARIDELLSLASTGSVEDGALASELYGGAITVLELTHGEKSSQMTAFRNQISAYNTSKQYSPYTAIVATATASIGSLKSLKREVEEGLVGNLRREVTGEILGDFLQLAKVTLDEGTENSKNVAAVLAAAAFEDTVRRLGATFCGISTPEGLPAILAELKKADVLKGSQVGVVQAHFPFRNHAMHADWDKIDAVAVGTALSLVQELLLKHFS